jgi:hypothetical protein
MKLNCQKDDMALVVRGPAGAKIRNGTVVTCKRFLSVARDSQSGRTAENVWVVDYKPANDKTTGSWCVEDYRLQPLPKPGRHGVDSHDVLLGRRAAA